MKNSFFCHTQIYCHIIQLTNIVFNIKIEFEYIVFKYKLKFRIFERKQYLNLPHIVQFLEKWFQNTLKHIRSSPRPLIDMNSLNWFDCISWAADWFDLFYLLLKLTLNKKPILRIALWRSIDIIRIIFFTNWSECVCAWCINTIT